jgi:alcohol dehydrogenase class IV
VAHWRTNTLSDAFTRHPLWLVPTTSGTGSEVTRWATVWDTDAAVHAKLSWAPANGFAERAFVDPVLTTSCPPRITRDCALDTLAHALESIWNSQANAATAALAVQAARLVISALPTALDQPHDQTARSDLSRASLLAGLAMSQTQTALAHALSYELTLHEGVPHGEACAVWLGMVWEMALGASPLCDETLTKIFDLPAADGAHKLRSWLVELGVTSRELRGDNAGETKLKNELLSARGRNFIARQH